jgi:hypothetical protein
VPRLTLAKQQARIRALEADRRALVAALQDAVKIIDEEGGDRKSCWTIHDVRRIEAIRFLSLGV